MEGKCTPEGCGIHERQKAVYVLIQKHFDYLWMINVQRQLAKVGWPRRNQPANMAEVKLGANAGGLAPLEVIVGF